MKNWINPIAKTYIDRSHACVVSKYYKYNSLPLGLFLLLISFYLPRYLELNGLTDNLLPTEESLNPRRFNVLDFEAIILKNQVKKKYC